MPPPQDYRTSSPSSSSEDEVPIVSSASSPLSAVIPAVPSFEGCVRSPFVLVDCPSLRDIGVRTETFPGKVTLHVCTIDGKDYLIGAQLAQALKKETYNLYRMLRKNGELCQLKPTREEVRYLVSQGALHRSSKTASLIPINDCSSLFDDHALFSRRRAK